MSIFCGAALPRESAANSPCKCGSRADFYNSCFVHYKLRYPKERVPTCPVRSTDTALVFSPAAIASVLEQVAVLVEFLACQCAVISSAQALVVHAKLAHLIHQTYCFLPIKQRIPNARDEAKASSLAWLHANERWDHLIRCSFKNNSGLAVSVNATNTMATVALALVVRHVANRHISYDLHDLRFLVLHSRSPFVGFIYKGICETPSYIYSSVQRRYCFFCRNVFYVMFIPCFGGSAEMLIYIFQVAVNKLHHRRTNVTKIIGLTL